MGSGFKDWAAGDVLTAADVDGYLMRQTVMTFADASARDTALSGVLDEGMVAYLEDVNALTVYNGSAWVAVIDSDVLTVDTANNRVGINDSTPSYALDVTGDINATGALRIGGAAIGESTTFTPSWTNFTPGNATESWTYTQVENFVYVVGITTLGSTSSVTGNPILAEPTGSSAAGSNAAQGTVEYFQSGTARVFGTTITTGGDFSFVYFIVETGLIKRAGVTATAPFTWATGDQIRASIVYQVS